MIKAPTPTRYEILPAERICRDSLSSEDFSLKIKAEKVKKATISPTISIVCMLSGIVKWPGFKNKIAIPNIAKALIVSVTILFFNNKQFFN